MEAQVAIIGAPASFNFDQNKIATMDLPTLRRTHKENDVYERPLKGVYHFEVIERALAMCQKYNLDAHVEEIFAASNQNKFQPGVTLLPQVEARFGPKAVEAHILRRVFTTIRIDNHQTDELTTTLALVFHQDGIQAAIGPCVKICHNQCIMGRERSVADYGKDKVTTEQVFETIDGWLRDFGSQMTEDRQRIERLKKTPVSMQEIYTYVGLLSCIRTAHDSSNKRLSGQVQTTYPLNATQINRFTEDVLLLALEKQNLTAWDIYNVATQLYKPEKADFPTLIPQNNAFVATLVEFCDNRVS